MTTNIKSLSSFNSIVAQYNNQQNLIGEEITFDNGLRLSLYEIFKNLQDAAFSNKNFLAITDLNSLENFIDNEAAELTIGQLGGTFYLKTPNLQPKYLQTIGNDLYFVNNGKILLNAVIANIESKTVNLYTSDNKILQTNKTYPYDIIASNEELDQFEKYRQEFEVDYFDGLITFKTKTQEGDRYLSYGIDNKLRAVGLNLNDTVVNNYLFVPEWISNETLEVGQLLKSEEIQYFNDFQSLSANKTLEIKTHKQADTNMLVSCSLVEALSTKHANINIAALKTNFNSSGTYSYE